MVQSSVPMYVFSGAIGAAYAFECGGLCDSERCNGLRSTLSRLAMLLIPLRPLCRVSMPADVPILAARTRVCRHHTGGRPDC